MNQDFNVEQYYKFFADLSQERQNGRKIYFIRENSQIEAIPLKDEELNGFELDKERSEDLAEFCYLLRKSK